MVVGVLGHVDVLIWFLLFSQEIEAGSSVESEHSFIRPSHKCCDYLLVPRTGLRTGGTAMNKMPSLSVHSRGVDHQTITSLWCYEGI